MFDVWKNVLAEFEQTLPKEQFTTWFTDTDIISQQDGVVVIGVPNVFKLRQLEKKYQTRIEKSLQKNGVNYNEIQFAVKKIKKMKKPREISSGVEKIRPDRVVKIPVQKVNQNLITTGLNDKYQIENFVIGSNNDLAVSVAKSVIENPGDKYNPFFLYGGPGLGKTHLVQAIGNALLKKNPNYKILYTPINHFYTEFVDAVRKGGMDNFRKKFRKLDVLIIDDFQFIVGKEKSQEEFFNIFNDMYQLNKQIIVTSDRLPSQIKTVDERLASRLTWAGAIDLQMPSFEDRTAILKSKAEFMGVDVEDEAIEYLAENIKTNIRELEGEFNRLIAMSDLKNVTPLELINEGYVNTVNIVKNKPVSAKIVVEKVAKYYQLSIKEMCGKSSVSHVKTARQVAMYLLSEELQMSTNKITFEVGVKDHTTVMHGIKKIKKDLKLNFNLRDQITEIRSSIYE